MSIPNQPEQPQQPPQQGGQPYYQPAPQYGQPAYAGQLPEPGPGEPFDGASHPDDLSRPLYGATFGQAIKRFFQNYVNFSGRASRSEYWWATLFVVLLQIVPTILYIIGLAGVASSTASYAVSEGTTYSAPSAGATALFSIGLILLLLISLAVLIPSISMAWRRLHDANLAGPFWFLSLTSVGSIVVLVFTILPPKPEGRRFISSR